MEQQYKMLTSLDKSLLMGNTNSQFDLFAAPVTIWGQGHQDLYDEAELSGGYNQAKFEKQYTELKKKKNAVIVWTIYRVIKKKQKNSVTVWIWLDRTYLEIQPSVSMICPLLSPWFNHTGWLGVKHQFTYLPLAGTKPRSLNVASVCQVR